ncbi:MAG: hypothetical protein ACYDBQ_09565 [Thermoplasmatota archaeon]
MFDFLAVLPVVGVMVVIGGIVALILVVQAKERQALISFAQSHGWSFTARDDANRPARYAAFRPFGEGYARAAFNIMTGTQDGVSFDLFDYRYTVGSGKNQQTIENRVAAFPMPVSAPCLRLSHVTFGDKIAAAFGHHDIQFESAEFSKRFWVQCQDRKFAFDAIDARMMEWLLANGADVSWQWIDKTLVIALRGTLNPQNCLPLVEKGAGFIAHLPRVLFEEQPLAQ